MHRGFGGTAFEPAEERRDRELTLGPTLLIALAIGLLALCSFCFLMGYAVGHRSVPATQAVNAPPPTSTAASHLFGNQPKPLATPAAVSAPTAEPATSPADDTGPQPAPAPAPDGGAAQSNVQAALPVQSPPAQPSSPTPRVAPALAPGAGWMVQIAAVSHSEDADVLVSALRRRGYAVSARREPADGLLHVQVGPFADHNQALSMRQRLLGDGYNAIVQP